MIRTLVNVNPNQEVRSMDEIFDRLFGSPIQPNNHAPGTLPLDILEQDGNFKVRASVPGIDPAELEIQIEKNVLTIRGEVRNENESTETKIYRREVSFGAFSRSVRLPDGLDLNQVTADFKNGIVTISLPRVPEEKPKSIKVNVTQNETNASTVN